MSLLDMREKIGSIFTFSVFSDVSKDLMQLRMIKSKEEIEIIKNGARIADLGGEEIVKNIREGNTEIEIAIAGRDRMEREIVKTYPEQNIWILGFGSNQELILMEHTIQKQIEN